MKSNINIEGRLSASGNNCLISVYKTLALTAILLFPLFNSQVVAQKESDQFLEPELEMDIIRYLNKEDRLANRQNVWPKRIDGLDGGDDVSGEWVCFTTMIMNAMTGKGIMYMKLEQEGDVISGINGQLKHPFDPPSTIKSIPERHTRGLIKGKWYEGTKTHMMVLERQALPDHRLFKNTVPRTWAIFTAVIAADGKSATAQLINHGGYYGTMLMVKREALKDYLPLLTIEGRQASEEKRLLGIELLEAGLPILTNDPTGESLYSTVNFWWKADRNKDNYLSYEEFQHPDWHRANLDGDDFLSWDEELIDRALRRIAMKGEYMASYSSSRSKEWSSWFVWGCDRPGFEWLFPFIDRNRDEKITADEYTAFEDQVKTFLDGTWPDRNEWGQSGPEVYFGHPRGPLKTTYDSQLEWSRYKGPKMAWVFPFIDKDNDGKISSEEHQAFEDYKEKYVDWQIRARKKLKIEPPQDR